MIKNTEDRLDMGEIGYLNLVLKLSSSKEMRGKVNFTTIKRKSPLSNHGSVYSHVFFSHSLHHSTFISAAAHDYMFLLKEQ